MLSPRRHLFRVLLSVLAALCALPASASEGRPFACCDEATIQTVVFRYAALHQVLTDPASKGKKGKGKKGKGKKGKSKKSGATTRPSDSLKLLSEAVTRARSAKAGDDDDQAVLIELARVLRSLSSAKGPEIRQRLPELSRPIIYLALSHQAAPGGRGRMVIEGFCPSRGPWLQFDGALTSPWRAQGCTWR